MKAPQPRSAGGAIALGGATTVVGLLPIFLAGAMAVQLTDELAFGLSGLGLAVAFFRGSAAALSVNLGRLADRLGSTWSIRLAAGIAAIGCLGIASTARSWITLVGWLIFVSAANALGAPASNRLLVRSVQPKRLGTAFGIKQAAPPVASMIAGLSVPFIALNFGWRWAYLLGAVLAAGVVLAAGRRPGQSTSPQADEQAANLPDGRSIVILSLAFGLATTASSTIAVFYVDAAVRAGQPPQFAGTILATASAAAIGTRVAAGMVSDRIASGHLLLCAGLLACGSVGLGLLATGQPSMMSIGGIASLAGAWGFNGVFWYAIVRTHPSAPGRVTGAVAPGALLGTTIGPIVFGVAADNLSYLVAWSGACIMALIASGAMVFGSRMLARQAR